MGARRNNEIAADEVFTRTLTVVAVLLVLLAPCTLGMSLLLLLWVPLARHEQAFQVESCIAGTDARAWSIAGLTVAGVTHSGVLWVVDDELFFSGKHYRGRWWLADVREVAFERPIGVWRGLRWFHGQELIQISVPDPDGWMRVMTGSAAHQRPATSTR